VAFVLVSTADTGLALADFSFRLYRGTEAIALPAGAVLTAVDRGYLLSGLPGPDPAVTYTLTWEHPAGVGSAASWRGPQGSPLAVIIPDRRAGLAVSDFSLMLYREGAVYPATLTATEIGSPGDYAVSGWPITAGGARWTLSWLLGGLVFAQAWTEAGLVPAEPPALSVVRPTALDRSARAMAERTIAKRGRTLVLRRPTTQPTAGGSVLTSPLSTAALLINGSAVAGSAVLGLRAASVSGLLVSGDVLRIAGDPTVYRVAGGPYAASGNALSGVGITPVLAADVADGAGVTVTFAGTDTPIKAVVDTYDLRLVGKGGIESGDFRVIAAARPLERLGIDRSSTDRFPHWTLFNGPSAAHPRLAIQDANFIPSGELDAAVEIQARAAR